MSPDMLVNLRHHAATAPTHNTTTTAFTPLKFTPVDRRRRRRLSTPYGTMIHGDIDTLGYFTSQACIGGQRFDLIVNSAGVTTTVPCAGCQDCGVHTHSPYDGALSPFPQHGPLSCDDPECLSGICDAEKRCGVSASFADGSSFEGHMVRDTFQLLHASRSSAEDDRVTSRVAFGCLTAERGLFHSQRADGWLGLARPTSVSSKNVHAGLAGGAFSVCLSDTKGALVLGGVVRSEMKNRPIWTPTSCPPRAASCTPGTSGHEVWLEDIRIGTTSYHPQFDPKFAEAGIDSPPPGQPLLASIDTGTTFTYVPSATFKGLLSYLRTHCPWAGGCSSRYEEGPYPDDLCYRASLSEINAFPKWSLIFAPVEDDGRTVTKHVRATLDVPAASYFYRLRERPFVWCLGVFDSGSSPEQRVTLGAASLRHHEVIFDHMWGLVGFLPADCDKMHDHDSHTGDHQSALQDGYGLQGCGDGPIPVGERTWPMSSPPVMWPPNPPRPSPSPPPPPSPQELGGDSIHSPSPGPDAAVLLEAQRPWPPAPPHSPRAAALLTPSRRRDPFVYVYSINGILSNATSFWDAATQLEGLAPGLVAAIAASVSAVLVCALCCCGVLAWAYRASLRRNHELDERLRLISATKVLNVFDAEDVDSRY